MSAYNYVKIKKLNVIVNQSSGDFEQTYSVLPSGVYSLSGIRNPLGHDLMAFSEAKTSDNLIKFKDNILDDVTNKVTKFFSTEVMTKYKEFGIGHKLGMVFYGPPGTGKTSTAFMLLEHMVKEFDTIALVCTGRRINFIVSAIKHIRSIQNNPIAIFVDEFDDAIENEEDEYLTFLDGEDSFEKLIFIGCTNYLENIPDRIIKRPSRIKYLHEINRFPSEVYRQYVSNKVPALEKELLDKIAYMAAENNLTIDQLKHVLIDYAIGGMDLDDAFKLITKQVKELEPGETL